MHIYMPEKLSDSARECQQCKSSQVQSADWKGSSFWFGTCIDRTKKLIVSSCAKLNLSTVPWLPDIHRIFLDQWSNFCFFAGKCVVLIFCFPCIVKLAFSTIAARQAADAIGTLTHDICLVIFASSNRDEAIMSYPCVCVCVNSSAW